jgi:hypothetical protein
VDESVRDLVDGILVIEVGPKRRVDHLMDDQLLNQALG